MTLPPAPFLLSPRYPLGWLSLLVTAGLLGNAVRLRSRCRRLDTLPPSDAPPDPAHRFLVAAGVTLDDATRRAASAYATREGLEVLDLLPAGLPAGRALELLRAVDPASYRRDRGAPGRGARHAMLASARVLERAQLTELDGLDPGEFARVAARLKRYASAATGLAVAPTLRPLAAPDRPAQRREVLQATCGPQAALALAIQAVPWSAATLGALAVLAGRAFGLVALAAFCAQPALVLAGTPLRPRGRELWRDCLLRAVREPLAWLGSAAGRWPPRHDHARYQQQRAAYAAAFASGSERFLEPRRDTCPWCGAGAQALSVLLRSGDVIQRKPGRFTLERCAACGHIFQNPRLTPEGLALYYRDFYDGAGEAQMEYVFGACTREYRGRAELLKPFTTPKAWLDVGTGHGHFCNHARDLWPDTAFDGLDLSASVEEAARRGWIDHAYRGLFPALAAELAGRYDVISMHHYLEHTREPLEELDAAAKALPPGGFLLIELPNPASRYGRLLGWRWMPWFQPQHQHLIPLENLQRALLERGLVPVAVERGRANQPVDLLFAGLLSLNALCPDPWLPWTAGQPTWPRRCGRAALLGAAVPLLALAAALDRLVHLLVRGGDGGNAYRVLAQKDSA